MRARPWGICRFGMCATLTLSAALMGCATPSRPPKLINAGHTDTSEWQGRLSVTVQSEPVTSMSAGFLLRGDAKNGELDLYSPLGTTLGALQWSPQSVLLNQGNTPERYNSLVELTEKTTGAALPIDAIFGWLQGQPIAAQGWQADLSNLAHGTLTAKRTSPLPEVTLRIKLD
jgi:outer membrane lipoprotein LolB